MKVVSSIKYLSSSTTTTTTKGSFYVCSASTARGKGSREGGRRVAPCKGATVTVARTTTSRIVYKSGKIFHCSHSECHSHAPFPLSTLPPPLFPTTLRPFIHAHKGVVYLYYFNCSYAAGSDVGSDSSSSSRSSSVVLGGERAACGGREGGLC